MCVARAVAVDGDAVRVAGVDGAGDCAEFRARASRSVHCVAARRDDARRAAAPRQISEGTR